jgi:predicted DNA-binding transcriptional regulator YafY
MPANKYALLRYRIIDRCLRSKSKPYPTKEDLRFACEEALYGSDGEHISMSTIDKDLWAMRNEGELGFYAPIKFDKARGGYFYEDPTYTIAELPLTDDDLNAIQTAAQTLFQFRDIPLFKQFDTAIEKILDRMKISNHNTGDVSGLDVIQFERSAAYVGSEYLEPLYIAARDQRSVLFEYKKFNTAQARQVHFDPYLLKEYKGRWYTVGMDKERGDWRTYSLDRITFMRVEEKTFTRSDQFDVAAFFKYAIGITVARNEPMDVLLRFDSTLAPYIMSQPLHSTQVVSKQTDTYLEIVISVWITIELISEILGFGDQVEVCSPSQLRSEVKQALTNCLKKYK